MQTQFKVIIDAGDLAEAITIYRHLLDEFPQSQIHLVRDMPSTDSASDGLQPPSSH